MHNDDFTQARRTLVGTMSPAKLLSPAIQFLEDGGELKEAEILRGCSLEYGDVRCQEGMVFQIDVTLRCPRNLIELFIADTISNLAAYPCPTRVRIKEALKASLPSGYSVANVEPRAVVKPPTKPKAPSAGRSMDDLFKYSDFTNSDFLVRLGRPLVDAIVRPFHEELKERGLSLPGDEVHDIAYFSEISQLLSLEERLPPKLRANINEILEKSREAAPRFQEKQFEEFKSKHTIVPLFRKDTGRGLLSVLEGTHGMRQDYPEKLTPEQAELVGWIMDFLRDCADCQDDIEPGDLLKYEQTVSAKIEELEQTGLAVFAGHYKGTIPDGGPNSTGWRIAVVFVAPTDSPTIKINAEGKQYIQGAIPKLARQEKPVDEKRDDEASTKSAHSSAQQKGNSNSNNSQGTSTDAQGTEGKLLFRKSGQVWRVVFEGNAEFMIRDTLGARYLDFLLHRPGQNISARELEVIITPEKGATRSNTSTHLVSDPEAVRSYLKEVDKLRADRDEAVDEGRLSEVERIDKELTQLETALKSFQIGTNGGERARGNVSKAIAAVEASLLEGEKHQRAFGEHLKECVSKGYTLRYVHPKGDVWQ